MDLSPASLSLAPRAFGLTPKSVLELSLCRLRLPTRMDNYAYSHGLETVGDLARLDPASLVRVRNLGRVSIKQTRAVLERLFGRSWESVREELCRFEGERLHS